MPINPMDNMTQQLNKMQNTVNQSMTAEQTNDPQTMLGQQFNLQQYSQYINFCSTYLKTLNSMVMAVISNIRP